MPDRLQWHCLERQASWIDSFDNSQITDLLKKNLLLNLKTVFSDTFPMSRGCECCDGTPSKCGHHKFMPPKLAAKNICRQSFSGREKGRGQRATTAMSLWSTALRPRPPRELGWRRGHHREEVARLFFLPTMKLLQKTCKSGDAVGK